MTRRRVPPHVHARYRSPASVPVAASCAACRVNVRKPRTLLHCSEASGYILLRGAMAMGDACRRKRSILRHPLAADVARTSRSSREVGATSSNCFFLNDDPGIVFAQVPTDCLVLSKLENARRKRVATSRRLFRFRFLQTGFSGNFCEILGSFER